MKRSRLVTLGTLAMLAASNMLTACSEPEADHSQICVDPETMERREDEECDNGGSGARWYYGGRVHPAPAVGGKVNPAHFSTTRPSGSITKIPRGGFGGHGGGGG